MSKNADNDSTFRYGNELCGMDLRQSRSSLVSPLMSPTPPRQFPLSLDSAYASLKKNRNKKTPTHIQCEPKLEISPSWISSAFMSRLASTKNNNFNGSAGKRAQCVHFENLESTNQGLFLPAHISKHFFMDLFLNRLRYPEKSYSGWPL